MIKTVNDLLLAIKAKGIKEIEAFLKIKHGPTIGDMYEGLTKKIVSKALFENTDIKVVSGFIRNADGDITRQIDCMIVVGDGEQIPNTMDYIYKINQVIMVIEVKKSLYSKELSDGFENLRSVYKVKKSDHNVRLNLIDDAFRAMVGKPVPKYENVEKLSIREQMIFHSLVVEAMLPIRVIFGFEGFSTEQSLRNKFIEYMDKNCMRSFENNTLEEAEEMLNSDDYLKDRSDVKYGYGVVSLPNLIIAGDNSLIKTNGMPYALISNGSEYTCLMASYRRNPLLLLLELLWTRLTYYYDLPSDVFGEDVEQEGLAPLLYATGTKNGWIYHFDNMDEKSIQFYDQDKPWEPIILNQNEFILLNILCTIEKMRVDDINKYVDCNTEEIVRDLNNKRLIYEDDHGYIHFLSQECICAVDPEYGYVAGDNKDGRFMFWIKERMERNRN